VDNKKHQLKKTQHVLKTESVNLAHTTLNLAWIKDFNQGDLANQVYLEKSHEIR